MRAAPGRAVVLRDVPVAVLPDQHPGHPVGKELLAVGKIHMPHPVRTVFMVAGIHLGYEILIPGEDNNDQQVSDQHQVYQ